MTQLGQATPRLLCSLVHKFGKQETGDFDAFIKELESQPSATVGELFVFVDECHRTQSGKLNRAMKAIMPGAVFIGFTGTPLLAKDRQTSLEVFGGYIHTYKFSEGVDDGVVLDLIYEARDIDQRLGSQENIDAWFDAKTQGLNDWQKDELRKKWGTMQHVLSSRPRMDRVVQDIIFDFSIEATTLQRAGQCHPGRIEHLRGVQVLRALPDDDVQGQIRGGDFVQPTRTGRDVGGGRGQYRDR